MSYKNLKKPNFRFIPLLALAFSLGLAGCGSGGKKGEGLLGEAVPEPPKTSSSSSGATSSSSSSSSSGLAAGTFVDPVNNAILKVSIAADGGAVAFGQSRKITLTFTNSKGEPLAPVAEISATSPCITVRKNSQLTAPVVLANTVAFNYIPQGCEGEDRISFVANSGQASVPVGTFSVTSEGEAVSSIKFVKTVPTQIFIAGGGNEEEATITFQVIGQSGKPLAGQPIVFSTQGVAGGVALVTKTAISNVDGLVSAQVRSGTTPNTVTIKALHEASKKEAPSNGLVVASGLPSDGLFSLAVTKRNPKAFNRVNDETTDIIAAVTDQSGNPVPDGTIVNFVSQEGGSVTPSCKTLNNTCTVIWKPNGTQPADGRAQVFATVKGSERFGDTNGNLIFDGEDVFTTSEMDLGEPFSDNNENGQYDIGEHFVDSNGDGKRDVGDGKWNGFSCKHLSKCSDGATSVDLGTQTRIIMSDINATICELGAFKERLWVQPGSAKFFGGLFISDGNANAVNPAGVVCERGNTLPNGTKFTFSVSGGNLQGTTSFAVGVDAIYPTGPLGISYKAQDKASTEVLTLKIEVPGVLPQEFVWSIFVSDTPPDSTSTLPDTTNSGFFVDPSSGNKVYATIADSGDGKVLFNETEDLVITFKTETGEPVAVSSAITATSLCVGTSRSEISSAIFNANTATLSYIAKGCAGDDLVTFKATANNKVVTIGTYKLVTEGEKVSSIAFVSATPAQLPLNGAFGKVTFKVIGESGSGLEGAVVNFSLLGKAGNVTLVGDVDRSDASGLVVATVRSGTTPGNITVLATYKNTNTAQSTGLVIASGLTTPNNFRISADNFTPDVFSFSTSAPVVRILASVRDRSGNPVIDGTSVSFLSNEAGIIDSECQTKGGVCSVGWKSNGNQPLDGRIQIVGRAKGSEDYTDVNGDLVYSSNLDLFDPSTQDLFEPYIDANENGAYDLGEDFADFDNNGLRTSKDNVWSEAITIQSSLTLALTQRDFFSASELICAAGTFTDRTIAKNGSLDFSGLYISDGNSNAVNGSGFGCPSGNSMPSGTTVTLSVQKGTLLGGTSWVVPTNTIRPNGPFYVRYIAPATGDVTDNLLIKIKPPTGGEITQILTITVTN